MKNLFSTNIDELCRGLLLILVKFMEILINVTLKKIKMRSNILYLILGLGLVFLFISCGPGANSTSKKASTQLFGLENGDALSDVESVFGKPSKKKITRSGAEVMIYYIGEESGLTVMSKKGSSKISILEFANYDRANGEEIESFLAKKGIENIGPLKYLGQSKSAIQAAKGKADPPVDPTNKEVLTYLTEKADIEFICPAKFGGKCSEVVIFWR